MPSKPKSRSTTPLRRVEKGGLSHLSASWSRQDPFPLDALAPAFAEMADALADVQHNFEHVQSIHSNLVKFSESFASFLYGLNMNAFCVDFPEAPVHESFKRTEHNPYYMNTCSSGVFNASLDTPFNVSDGRSNMPSSATFLDTSLGVSADTTFTTNDTSFIERPSQNTRQTRSSTPKTSTKTSRPTRQSSFKTNSSTHSSTRPRHIR
ncbi:hypothetical protein PORY_001603 [Pneumocystis oryctolagi]|uniref:Uncharacterized protein n=1 Tax=Pneumocystis oryctolagi TaxID=42067 RepID=A0ACB7CDB0_9ASCO|nr:hypothetical protein PORY_001603 [Pneumocystis oryctolagi]